MPQPAESISTPASASRASICGRRPAVTKIFCARSCLDLAPEGGPARVFLVHIIARLLAQALPENWNGVWMLSEK